MLATWGCSTFPKPTLDLQFAGATSLDNRITFSRGSTATYFDQLGVLQTAAINTARFDYNPSTLAAQGLLIEEQRTNSIRNNTMQGAVAGTPGTLPTNWGVISIGLTQTIVGTGTENGITYVDIRLNGTTTGQFGNIRFEPNNNVVASSGQTWATSAYLKLVGGSLTNIGEVGMVLYSFTSAPAFISSTTTSAAVSSTLTRFSHVGTLPATTAFVQPAVYFNTTAASGQAVDFTLRIGLPQLEQGAFATSVIPTTTTALTRNADVVSMTGTNFSLWFNASEGTIVSTTQLANTVAANRAGYDINDNSTNNRIIFRVLTTGGGDQSTIRSGGITQVQDSTATAPTTAVRKSAIAYKVNDFAFVANAGAVVADNSGAVPVAPTQILIGSAQGGGEFTGGYIQRIAYYPVRLPNSTLQALTA